MKYDVIRKKLDGILKYIWVNEDRDQVSPELTDMREIIKWFENSEHCKDSSSANKRIHITDRRSGAERRTRVSNFPDRRNEYGRRWKDRVKKFDSF